MNRSLSLKLGIIAVLIIALLIPIQMISGLIEDRQIHRDTVLEDIARSSSYSQKLMGPLLVVPYQKKTHEWKIDTVTKTKYSEETVVKGQLYFLPDKFKLDGTLKTEVRSRGIYQARLYHSDSHISGSFNLPAHFGIEEAIEDYTFEQPSLVLGVSDIRGIESAPQLKIDNTNYRFEPGTQIKQLGDGIRAKLAIGVSDQRIQLPFEFQLKLQGTQSLNFVPVGADSTVSLKSDWPHPSFIGEYLPSQREIGEHGFTAQWQASFFSTNMNELLQRCLANAECEPLKGRDFGVSLIDPVDQYLKSERAIKYALLFIGLTFAAFFLFEVLKRLAVHPIQYSFVGVAMAMFYLLLISLSEHVGFNMAYAVSATACVVLVGTYVSGILHSVKRGLGFSVGLTALYGLLYSLLNAEDYSLLMGSLLLFMLLGVVMMATRRIDWFGLGKEIGTDVRQP